MCDFVSWIKLGDEVFFLTDNEVFSPEGRKKFKDSRDNDPLGHGAIREFFQLGILAGYDHQERNFWNLKNLPEEIAKKLKTPKHFDRNFGRMLNKFFQKDDLMFIVISDDAPDAYRQRAYKQLLKKRMPLVSASELITVVEHAPDAYREKAYEQLLKREMLSNRELADIIKYTPESYREKLEKLLREKFSGYMSGDKVKITQNPTLRDLRPHWVPGMDRFKGKILTLARHHDNGNWYLRGTHYIFNVRWFKPIKKDK